MVAVLRRVARIGNVVQLIFDSEEDARLFLCLLGLESGGNLLIRSGDGDGLRVRVEWNNETRERFVEFIRKKKPPARVPETIEKYIRCIERFLERSSGVITVDALLKHVRTKHDNRALRNLLHFLYYYRFIDKYVYEELLSRVPRPSNGGNGLAEDYVPLSAVLRSFARVLDTKRFEPSLKLFYLALYYSGGQRMEQLLEAIKNPRYQRIGGRGYARLRVQGSGTKEAWWAWIPLDILEPLIRDPPRRTPAGIRQKLHRNHVVTPTYIRSFCWQTAKQILGHDLALLLQGRIGELKKYTTAMSYDDLVFQLDEKYSVWKQFIDELVENRVLDIEESMERARRIREKYRLLIPV